MDCLVTVPRSFGLENWALEGDLPGQDWSGESWYFYLGGPIPKIQPGERVYICYNGKLRGYAPLVRIDHFGYGRYALVRHGGAVAITLMDGEAIAFIRGFRGYRYRWWSYKDERPFPEWRIA